MVNKKKAIEICKNLLKTIKKVENKPPSTITYFRVDMCSFPITSLKDLKTKLKSILKNMR